MATKDPVGYLTIDLCPYPENIIIYEKDFFLDNTYPYTCICLKMKLKKSDKVRLKFLSVCKNEQGKAVLSILTLGQF